MSRARLSVVGSLLVVSAVLGAGHLRTGDGVAEADVRRTGVASPAPRADGGGGLQFRLSEGTEPGEAPALVARPPAERLPDPDARRVLDRLPPLASEPHEEPFAIRDGSLPPPRTGRSVRAAFPPADEAARPDAAATGPLEILRRMPEGDVPLAPHLSITFSQPMVALDSHASLSREAVPARLSPQPPGEWRWVGTRTLVFAPESRFPMATDYRVEVPAATRAATGGTLASATGWTFSTPPPRLVVRHPEPGPARRDTLMLAVFDQRVDPAAVLASVRVRAGGTDVPVRLATAAEVAADEAVGRLAGVAEPGRFVAFRSERELRADAAVTVTVGPGTASAEGPRRSAAAQEWGFRTYGPFRVRRHECGWGGRCTPFDPWRVELTNPIDAKKLRKELVHVEPDLPGLKVEAWGDTLALRGVPRGRTTYRVSLSSGIADAFGQPLEAGPALAFAVGAAPAALFAPGGEFVVLDPAGGPRFPVHSVNHESLRVEVHAVGPEHWAAWQAYRQKGWRDEAATLPGRRVIDTTVRVGGEPDALTETRLDLAPAFEGGLGQAILVVRPTTPSKERRRERVQAWVQATRIGLDAFADQETLVAWASDLADGRPLGDVEIVLARGGTGPSAGPGSARSDASGLARLVLGDAPAPLLVARRGKDVAILPSETGWWSEGAGWRRTARTDSLRFYVFDDRKMYRPGEEVRVKGWLRRLGAGPRGDVEALPATVSGLAWTLQDSQGNEVAKGQARVSGFGGFDLALRLPPTMNLGAAVLQLDAASLSLPGSQHTHVFQVQEFRRPEFEVKAQASEGPHVVGGAATVAVSAAYYAG
ncbi:MAG TPA: Ig-like domain-containing protein, partial [Vicinamibacteria bacterium]|nr:Ig-like domain-containing protein [Vicinamibacteria bacterium]